MYTSFFPLSNKFLCTGKNVLLFRTKFQCFSKPLFRAYKRGSFTYEQIYQKSITRPEEFWAEQAEKLVWSKKWDTVIDDSNSPFTKWLVMSIVKLS